MNELEKHPDFLAVTTAHNALSLQYQENLKLATHKLKHAGPAGNPKFNTINNLGIQNADLNKSIERYFAEIKAGLVKTHFSLDVLRDGKFKDEVMAYEARLELIKLRLEVESESALDRLDIFECRGEWYVAQSDAKTPIKPFPSEAEAKTYVTGLKRNFRVLSFLSDN